MSLAINTDKVEAVLLSDGWHNIVPQSFVLDAYEFVSGDDDRFVVSLDSSPMGFEFHHVGESGGIVSGPLSAIVAVRHKP